MRAASWPISALFALASTVCGAELPYARIQGSVEAIGGHVLRGSDGNVIEVSLARTWASDDDVERLTAIKTLQRLDLSFTYVTDAGVQKLQELPDLKELNLETAEALTDAAASYLRGLKHLEKLVFRGVDITDVGMPNLSALTTLRSLDLSHTMVGNVGLESLPALGQLEELRLGGDAITGINLNFLKLLPKLKKLSLDGIQRRNAGACWTPLVTDLDLDTISLLSGLEELDLGVGVSLGRTGKPEGSGNCHVTGGIQLTDLGVVKLAKLNRLRRLDISGAKVTATGLKALGKLPNLDRLSLWNCAKVDDAAASELASFPKISSVDLSETPVSDATLRSLARLPGLKTLYLTDTKVTPEGLDQFRKTRAAVFVSWARRPEPPPGTAKPKAKPETPEVEPEP
jgi:hypothetical protein